MARLGDWLSRDDRDALARAPEPSADPLTRECSDCRVPFAISDAEASWYRDQRLTLPRRCAACRRARRGRRRDSPPATTVTLTCKICQLPFVLPADRVARLERRGLAPRLCGPCLEYSRQERADGFRS